jgi:secondary thiamine-phosphate synthase enzyme
MKINNGNFGVRTSKRNQMIDITGDVSAIINKSGIDKGDVTVYCPHTTAGITINENADPSVIHDILLTLEHLVPHRRSGYKHTEGNSDSHCKSTIVGCSERILINNGSLELGTWQSIFFCEFDGPRSRKVLVQVRGE